MSIDCVILAAGLSSRAETNKLALKIDGKTVIERCIGAFCGTCSRIIVVTGKYHDEVKQCTAPYPNVRIVYNRDYPDGMFSSVKEGIRYVRTERFFLTPGDYPLLRADTIRCMANAAGRFVVPVREGMTGHPILLDSTLIQSILTSSDVSLRDCLRNIRIRRQEINIDDIGIITDIDTMDDYRRCIPRAAIFSGEPHTGN